MRLSPRLERAISLIPISHVIADVGTDHGQLALEVLRRGIAERVIATDISLMSLKKAEKLIVSMGYEDFADFRCGDGLSVIREGEIDLAVILGMGGMEIMKILSFSNLPDTLILSPQHDTLALRDYLVNHGFMIAHDETVLSQGRYYDVIKAIRGGDSLTESERYFGRTNVIERSEDFVSYLKHLLDKKNRGVYRVRDDEDNRRFFEILERLL